MWGIQPLHLLVIAIVALIIFGPKRLPEIGRGLAKAFREFRNGMKDMGDGFRDELGDDSGKAASVATTTATSEVKSQGPFCTQCGAANEAESRFCHKCGTPLAGKA